MTRLVHHGDALREACERARARGQRVGVVPTMGALHEGHLQLIDGARRAGADFVVVTVFVNPLQFGPEEDLARYPRTLDADLAACRSRDVDLVFAPDANEMYPDGFATEVRVAGSVTEGLEGAHRPGHFHGVTTVVLKLLLLTCPCLAVFGKKDYQQWRVLSAMVRDLSVPVTLHPHPIVREPDGLALSSRNRYLTPDERQRALSLRRGLLAARELFDRGERDSARLVEAAQSPLAEAVDRIDYVALADPLDLCPAPEITGEQALLAIAAHIGTTRLIDNTVLGEPES